MQEDTCNNPQQRDQVAVKRRERLTLEIDHLAYGGAGVARFQDLVIFVEKGLPGQRVEVEITKKKKKFAEAKILSILRPSPFHQQPICRHFGYCGGCSLQNLTYEKQLEEKTRQVAESLHHLGGFTDVTIASALSSPQQTFYRNKMEFSFAEQKYLSREELAVERSPSSGIYLGLHAKGFYNKVIDLQECHLLTPVAADLVDAVRRFARADGRPVYHSQSGDGFWRFLVMRHAKHTNELLVNLVTRTYDEALAEKFCQQMMQNFPQITSLLFSTTQNRAGVAFSESEHLLYGRPSIRESIGPLSFAISSNSFLQTNSLQAERLYEVIKGWAAIQPHEIVYDLYCGAGTISFYVADSAFKVIGFEAIGAAVADAKINAQENNISNCTFVLGDLRDQLSDTEAVLAAYGRPDVMIIDPPRAGMHPKTVQAILWLQPSRIIHVSCNPATLARDLRLLCDDGYHLLRVQPVDMFPHTNHIEVVTELRR